MVGLTKREPTTSARENYEERNLKRFGKGNVESGRYKRRKKKKIVGRDRSNTSRQGVGTLEKVKPQRKDMTGVNQTPITLKDVGKSTGKGAAEGVAYGLGGIGVGALKKVGTSAANKFSKANLLKKFRNMFKSNKTVQKFFPKSVKRITDQRTTAQKQAVMKKETARLKALNKTDKGYPVQYHSATGKAKPKPREELTIRDLGMYGAKKGGLVKKKSVEGVAKSDKRKTAAKKTRSTTKKKSIDGIAMRGKTRATRSR